MQILNGSPELLNEKTHKGSWLHQAAFNDQLVLMQRLLELGIDININGFDDDGTALDAAAAKGHLNIVRYLHEHGGILDTSASQRNPLFAAIVGGHTDVARYLIEQGIDMRPKYKIGNITDMDALKFARYWGRSEIVDLIQQRLNAI